MRYLLNSAVLTAFGEFSYSPMTVESAKQWLSDGPWSSGIGYEQTADAMSELFGVTIPVVRVMMEMEPGDEALVFRLKFPAGTPRIDPKDKGRLSAALIAGHYEIGLLRRTK